MAAPAVVKLAARSPWARRLVAVAVLVAAGVVMLPVFIVVLVTADDEFGSAFGQSSCTAGSGWQSGVAAQYPQAVPYLGLVEQAATRYGIDPAVLAALISVESGWNPSATSPAGAQGLVQLMPGTAAGLGVTNRADPAQSVRGGAAYLRQQLDSFGGSVEVALAAYNAGPGAVQRHGGVPPYAETRSYVTAVMDLARQFGAVDPSVCGGPTPEGVVGEDQLVEVWGIRVHRSIGAQVDAMIRAAAADGVRLSGSGWRDSQRQAELRRTNGCPDIWTRPARECRVPTAIPGTSMHERGLAIDFDNCSSRGTACFRWLDRNAARFGLFNLPSEPWHWSTTGG